MEVLNEVKLKFLSRSVNEAFARSAAAGFILMLDPTLDELADIKTAISEAVTNCIVHAYGDTLGEIEMQMQITDERIFTVTVKDKGRGIENIKQAMEACFTTGGEERSGMGFTVMEAFMDSVHVTSKAGRGTKVVMKKYINRRGN